MSQFQLENAVIKMLIVVLIALSLVAGSHQSGISISNPIDFPIRSALTLVIEVARNYSERVVNVISCSDQYPSNIYLASAKIPIIIERVENLTKTPERRVFSIIFLESTNDFEALQSKLTSKLFDYRGYFLIILINIQEQAERILHWFWRMQIFNINVLLKNDDKSVSLYTFLPFISTTAKCIDTTPVLINQFTNGTFSKSLANFFPDKTSNLHGCGVRVATSNDGEPYVFAQQLPNGSYKFFGRDIDLMETLAEELNFKINYTYVGEGGLFQNGTAEGPYLQLINDNADLIIADYWLVVYRLKFIDTSVPYHSAQMIFLVPPGAEFTSFQKFMRPLDALTWTCLLLSFAIGFAVILITRKALSKNFQNFLIGAGINNPNMNILIAIFGGSQHKLPRKNFARSLLMMFLMYCLVMRTIYTGSLYGFLKSKLYHKETRTTFEMVQKDYKIYHLGALTDVLSGARTKIYNRYLSISSFLFSYLLTY